MAWPPGDAVTRRDEALYRTRKLTLGTATGALAATGVLGFAFAHALPGHSAAAAAKGGQAAAPGSAAGATHSSRPHPARSRTGRRRARAATQAPSQPQPAPTTAPPQVVSGGS
jgi:hypothetical protein